MNAVTSELQAFARPTNAPVNRPMSTCSSQLHQILTPISTKALCFKVCGWLCFFRKWLGSGNVNEQTLPQTTHWGPVKIGAAVRCLRYRRASAVAAKSHAGRRVSVGWYKWVLTNLDHDRQWLTHLIHHCKSGVFCLLQLQSTEEV